MTTKATSYILTNAVMEKSLNRRALNPFDSLCNKIPDLKPCFALNHFDGFADWLIKLENFLTGFSGVLINLETQLGI
jgi:hypothetical protein